jgi:hypothetical protein
MLRKNGVARRSMRDFHLHHDAAKSLAWPATSRMMA